MVLRANLTSRFDENRPPVLSSSKSVATRLRDAARRRRSRVAPYSKYAALDKRHSKKQTPTSLRLKVSTIDVEMKDAVPSRKTTNVALQKQLARPAYCEVSKQAIAAVSPELASEDSPSPDIIRNMLPQFGHDMLRVLSSVTASPSKDSLPDELAIIVNDMTCDAPTHLMAVYSARAVPGKPTEVKLYPAHGIVFAANCAKLPPLGAPISGPSPAPNQLITRVQPLCLPSPQSYPQLSNYLYTKQVSIIYSDPFLPKASQSFDPAQHTPIQYATELARKYTGQALLHHIGVVHGLWQNVVALGIFDDDLWTAMDTIWQTLLTALAISTGNPSLMI